MGLSHGMICVGAEGVDTCQVIILNHITIDCIIMIMYRGIVVAL